MHIHDFFRPFEYPRVLPERFGVYWQEHYLVQALLAHSARWRAGRFPSWSSAALRTRWR